MGQRGLWDDSKVGFFWATGSIELPSIKTEEAKIWNIFGREDQEFSFRDSEFEMSKSWVYEPGVGKRGLGWDKVLWVVAMYLAFKVISLPMLTKIVNMDENEKRPRTEIENTRILRGLRKIEGICIGF